MNIIWVHFKRFDTDLDAVTWIVMVNHMSSKNREVTLVTGFSEVKRKYDIHGTIVYLKSLKTRVLFTFTFCFSWFFYLLCSLIKKKSDVVILDPIAIFPTIPFLALSKIGLINTKFVLDIRTLPVELKDTIDKLKAKIFDLSVFLAAFFCIGVSVISPAMKLILCSRFKLSSNSICIWFSGVNTSTFRILRSQQKIKLADINDKFVVLYHGSLSENRGLYELIDSIEILRKRGYLEIVLLIIGGGSSYEKLIEKVKLKKLNSFVHFLGVVDHKLIPEYINIAHIGVVPLPNLEYWNVSSPLKLLEYLACGKPVVATNIEANKIGENLECIYYTQSSASEELADGILHFYAIKNRLTEIGAKGRDIILDQFTWEKQAKTFLKFLEKLVDHKYD